MYSIHNEGKSVVAERFIRTIKNKIYKYMTSISKNVYIDKLDDIVNEYNNTYHRTIKMKPNLKLVIMKEYQNTKTFLLKAIIKIVLKKSLSLKKLKIQFHALMLLMILMVEKILEHSIKMSCKGQSNKKLESKKESRKKVINYMSNGKDMKIHLIVGLIKKT